MISFTRKELFYMSTKELCDLSSQLHKILRDIDSELFLRGER